MVKNTRLLLAFGVFLVLLFAGCTIPFLSNKEIKTQEGIIASNLTAAEKLLDFEEQAKLSSATPIYQSYSDEIKAACEKLDTLDKDKNLRSANAELVCENKKGLDNCFFQLEKIKMQVKDSDTSINFDSLDVLCSDLRSMGLQNNLDSFKSQYKDYAAWLKGEEDMLVEWGTVSALLWNDSSSEQLSGAKLSDYYKEYTAQMATTKTSLQTIASKCALKNDYKITNSKVERICNNVDDYLVDIDKANAAILDTFNFFSSFEVGTVAINSVFVRDCNQANEDFVGVYDLELFKDTQPEEFNQTDFGSICTSLEELSYLYGSLGIPLIFENGEFSSTTKNELFKAKTVFVETDAAIGSGVILSSDSSGYYILTNAHVALTYDPDTGMNYLPSYVRVKFYDGNMGYATDLGYTQEGYDLALLYVPSSGNYPTATYYEDYYPSAGDKVVAVGNPYGLEFSTSQGTVSGIRDAGCFDAYCYGWVIQTDTAINPGNSGGGLWDYNSDELLGINSFGLSQAEGLNFAISMYQYGKIKDTFKWYEIT
ncbi:MAG: trypsin-like peptidase domain-containing protein [Candidatus Burarchaeum sp.]|nr:trypsin-like peptidase domain-containing protein [Candidatus Burarchaeum sp.]MDO8340180.1 trypsin-like peptidase domain-containing protein [Candidatus Burarchaeum sp.]